MINQINTSSANKNVFAPIQSSNGANYAISTPIYEHQENELEIAKDKKQNYWGYSIAATGFVVGLGALWVAKGLPPRARNFMNKIYREMVDKSNKIESKEKTSWLENLHLKALKGLKILTTRSKIVFNAAPFKDAWAKKVIEKSPKLNKFCDKITDWFERVSVKTSRHQYNNTMKHFDSMYAAFDEANAKIPQDVAERIKNRTGIVQDLYRDNFSSTGQNRRLKQIKNDMQGIHETVYKKMFVDWKNFYSLHGDAYKTFVSEDAAINAKIKVNTEVNAVRAMISNGLNDDYAATRRLLSHIDMFIDPTDPKSRALIKNIGKTLDEYKKFTERGKEARQVLFDGRISNNIKTLDDYIKNCGKYSPKDAEEISKSVAALDEILKVNKRGQIQEILAEYKKHLPKEDYEKVKKIAYKATGSLNKSIDTEVDKLFDKVRDLLIGSAPVDVLGVLSSLGVIGLGLAKADNNDERVSASLKYGIPAVGGVVTTLICTLGLVSAGPSLIIGGLSGILINKLGIEVDNMRKRYQGKKVNPNEATITQVGLNVLSEKMNKTKVANSK